MNYTPNYNLKKPEPAEQYNLADWNDNTNLIDTTMHELQEQITAEVNRATEQENTNRNVNRLIGTLQISQGGTGQTTAQDSLNALHESVATQNSIDADDEITFIKRTPADVSQGTSETIDLKDVTLTTLAEKVFEMLKSDNNKLFNSSNNGFVPKSGASSASTFLCADGTWSVPQNNVNTVVVTSSGTYSVVEDTTYRIQDTATLVINDATKFGLKIIFRNETNSGITISLTFKGNNNYLLYMGKKEIIELVWLGNTWGFNQEYEPLTTLKPLYTNNVPSGYLLCDGRNTTGTVDELQKNYPALYNKLRSNVLPDYRECAIVGIGQNSTNSMGAHDVFTLGQFKDDCMQNFSFSFDTGMGNPANNTTWWNHTGSGNAHTGGSGYFGDGQIGFSLSSAARTGTITRGKRKGALICIKAVIGYVN